MLADTPPVLKGSSNLFRNLRHRGIVGYTEYLFLLCILTKPHAEGLFLWSVKEFEPRGMWNALRKGASQALFSDLEVNMDENMTDTTLLVHFFGKKGKAELGFDDFYRFMDNLQTEVLEIEFLSYSKGLPIISEEDFAHILLRFTNVDDIAGYLDNVRKSITDEKGITFDEFRSFFQFMNNLEDFAIAMQMYNFANRSIGQDELARAVYVTTGLKLTEHLVNTVFHIFDEDRDGQLSYKEFIGVMKDRLHRRTVRRGAGWQGCREGG
uniref:EF-hand domain-containing protein n=1 Tax=Hucho hucho TaxID=62062 RepID=A0A4W5LNY7_9TELE